MAKRLTLRGIGDEVVAQLNLERGLLRTIVDLAIKPGPMMRSYISGETRSIYMRPFTLFALVAAVSTFVYLQFPGGVDLALTQQISGDTPFASSSNEDPDPEMVQRMLELSRRLTASLSEKQTLFFYVRIPLLALFTWILFRSWRFNFAEHLVVNALIQSEVAIITLLAYGLMFVFPGSAFGIQQLNWLIVWGYSVWALAQLTDRYTFGTFLRIFVVYLVGGSLSTVAMFAIMYWLEPEVLMDIWEFFRELGANNGGAQ